MIERVYAGKADDWAEGEQRAVTVGEDSVVVIRYEGQFYALKNLCTHQAVPLLGGEVADGKIACEKHGGKFELSTGKARALPAVKPVKLYQVTLEGGSVLVGVL
ncbi:non-heme iron oxygenase ferredoxin subunit [Deinococcus lacus]|uniref:Non-heme iron oxygenase ferredoxin subunit n=1 Tax=Deinococcus lacus TaxID=392561 RepID=A0ABW1YG51_9DEIO